MRRSDAASGEPRPVGAFGPPNGHGLANREVAALSAYFFLYFAAIAFAVTFGPIFLRDRGLSLSQIAVLSAVSAVVGGLTQARVGHWSDSIGSRRGILVWACLLLGAAYLFVSRAYTFAQFMPLYVWIGATSLVGFTLPQAIVSDWTSAAGSTARGFSATRIWGTAGFIVALLCVTRWPAIAEGSRFLYWASALFVASTLPVLLVREAPIRRTDHTLLRGAARVLSIDRSWVFLACYTVFRLCESGNLSYMGLYLREMGGSANVIAAAYWIAAVAELPVLVLVGKLSDRVGRKAPLVVAFAIWPVRLYFYSLITVPSSIYYIQLFHGLTYGIMLICSVAYMSDIAPRDLRGTAQGLLSIASAAAMAAGPLLMGLLGDAVGLAATFRVMAVIMVVALAAFVLFVREPVGASGDAA